ncbi:SMP-30/gluconolactonase/LRE family protein [Pseudomonas tolaasii]|nr:SMP-30/gluconolactonase/LRE family protein [Pseudomonas tolaasii]MBW1250640.1 SMP-30/gluconolactonase/LRE family protein [Pseudomonas tolaasii]MBY8944179.1 SMP-30/gluconolactonase/LRE family protein [Pseudomonas tolaasii]PKA78355.1 SMP-30/gluconolaconase/LRE-like protein [Pseudomonas tolaasii NCPPB 2192]
MKPMTRPGYALVLAVAAALLSEVSLAADAPAHSTQPQASRLLVDLGPQINTPDGLGIAPDGTLILSAPNFNNDHLLKQGLITRPAPPFMAAIDHQNKVSHWYDFKASDLHPDTGHVGPMDNAFGPDGNLYVADMQVFFSKDHKSRILRINVKDGKATGVDVVAEGLIAANGLVWEGDTLYVTDSLLIDPATQAKGAPLVSGVYALPLNEMQKDQPIKLKPYSPEAAEDSHLVKALTSSGKMGFGADGIVFDDKGHLFVSTIEDATIYDLTLNAQHKAVDTKVFAQHSGMTSVDGMIFDPVRQMFYVADFLGNAVHAIDRTGHVTTLQKNGDTTGANGELDQPAEVIQRGNELVIVNMDMAWATPGLSVNTQVDTFNNLSVIDLPPASTY